MPSLILTWDTAGPNPCPFCISMNGYTWKYKAGTHKLPPKLSAKGQYVWDLAGNHAMTHGGTGKNCHCLIKVDTNTQDVLDFAKTLTEALR
jgi:hypothetical protein